MNKMKRKHYKRTSRHHVIPKSRGGSNDLENISKIDYRNHQFYHALFENRTPPEIIENLVTKYWNGNWDYLKESQMTYHRH